MWSNRVYSESPHMKASYPLGYIMWTVQKRPNCAKLWKMRKCVETEKYTKMELTTCVETNEVQGKRNKYRNWKKRVIWKVKKLLKC